MQTCRKISAHKVHESSKKFPIFYITYKFQLDYIETSIIISTYFSYLLITTYKFPFLYIKN